ncbi:MAG: hypothetical protein Q9162_006319 [Coniocarpon cinnabarinum]
MQELLLLPSLQGLSGSPFKRGHKSLVYPFLVLEAKREASATLRSIRLQTAFPLRTLLNVQSKLMSISTTVTTEAVNEDALGRDRPLLCIELWNGDIVDVDKAMQLLMIVDYILDWARDAYRPTVLKRLNVLANSGMTGGEDDDLDSPVDLEHLVAHPPTTTSNQTSSVSERLFDIYLSAFNALKWVYRVLF